MDKAIPMYHFLQKGDAKYAAVMKNVRNGKDITIVQYSCWADKAIPMYHLLLERVTKKLQYTTLYPCDRAFAFWVLGPRFNIWAHHKQWKEMIPPG